MPDSTRGPAHRAVRGVLYFVSAWLIGVLSSPHNVRDWIELSSSSAAAPVLLIIASHALIAILIILGAFAVAPAIDLGLTAIIRRARLRKNARRQAQAEDQQRQEQLKRLEEILRVWWDAPEMRELLIAARNAPAEAEYYDALQQLDTVGAVEILGTRRNPALTWMSAGSGEAQLATYRLSEATRSIVRQLEAEEHGHTKGA